MSKPQDKRPAPSGADESHTTAAGSRMDVPLDQTLALPESVAPDDHATQQLSGASVPPTPVVLDQTLAGDAEAAASALDQTMSDASLPSAAPSGPPTEGLSNSMDAPTRPGTAAAAARRAAQHRHDTIPLTTEGDPSAIPMTRYGAEASSEAATNLAPTEAGSGFHTPVRLPSVPGYVLMSELGRGGMGIVYKARQTKLNRVIALKMIRAGAQAGSEDLRRFRAEAEAVAKLTHPNIVQIYEIGETDGLPWFSLEYIDGGSLHQKLRKDTALPSRQAAELVETLARAMHYAHERGIVHRDLKPANIMLATPVAPVGERGRVSAPSTPGADATGLASMIPKITDFGLAKHLEKDTGHTREGSILGTPSYMAPEQAEGKNRAIGPPADVYALGAILYDLLASRPPFRGETVVDTLQLVINTDPLPPTRLQPALSRDLETICLKCLQKDPRKRYSSALTLANDLRRYLNGEPIEARATAWWEKAVKWSRRRPAAAALILFGFLASAGVVTGSMIFAAEKSERAANEARLRGIAEENEEKERQQRERADELATREAAARLRADRRSFDAMIAVERLLTMADEKLEHLPQLQDVRANLLTEAARFLHRFHNDNKQDPELREHLAFGQKRLAEILVKLGEEGNAEVAYRESFELFRGLSRASPDNVEYRRNAAILAEQLGIRLQKNQQPLAASRLFDQSIRELMQARPHYPDEKGRLALLAGVVVGPAQPFLAPEVFVWNLLVASTWKDETEKLLESLGVAHLHRGNLRQLNNEVEPARKDMKEALGLFEQLSRLEPGQPRYQWRQAVAHSGLGVNLLATDVSKGVKEIERAIALLTPLTQAHSQVADYRAELAYARRYRGILVYRFAPAGKEGDSMRAEAELDLSSSADLLNGLSKDYKRTLLYHEQLIESRSALASFYRDTAQPARGLQAWREALSDLDRLPDRLRDSFDTRHKRALFQDELAKALVRQATPRYQEAAQAWEGSIRLLAALVKEKPSDRELWNKLTNRHFNRCLAQRKQGLAAEAVVSYREYVAALEARNRQFKEPPADRAELALTLFQWAEVQRERTLTSEAETNLKRATALQRSVIADEPKQPLHRRTLCVYLTTLGDHAAVLVTVKDWDSQLEGGPALLHEAAWCLAHCTFTIKPEAKKVEEMGQEAARLLKKAMGHGFKDASILERAEWGPLRMHADFKDVASLLRR